MERFSNNFNFLFIKNREPNLFWGNINLPIVVEELRIKEFIKRELPKFCISKIEIERPSSEVGKIKITIYARKVCPNEKIKKLKNELKNMTEKDVTIEIKKINDNETQLQSVANNSSVKIDESKVYKQKKKIIYPKLLKQKERKRI